MICAAAVFAQFIAGKATRDALYLVNLDVTSLPAMVIATAVLSMGLVFVSARGLRIVSPATFFSLAFTASAGLLLAAWALVSVAPRFAATMVYLLISGVGPMLGSGFWLIATERFDPHTAKKRFGQIGGAGTLGGLAGGLLAERVAAAEGVAAMLPLLAVLNLFAAWQIRQLGASVGEGRPSCARQCAGPRARPCAFRLSRARRGAVPAQPRRARPARHDRRGADGLPLQGTGRGDLRTRRRPPAVLRDLLRSDQPRHVRAADLGEPVALEKLGLAVSAGTPSLALFAGSVGGLLAPGFASTTAARGGESVFRGSLYRSGYELFYTPIPVAEKRAAKSLIDVGVDGWVTRSVAASCSWCCCSHPPRNTTSFFS